MIASLPPLTRDEADEELACLHTANLAELDIAKASLSELTDKGESTDDAQARVDVLAAAVNAPPSQAGSTGQTFLSTASDGAAARRIPNGWQEGGICWTPFCCTGVNSFLIDCDGDGCPDDWEVPLNEQAFKECQRQTAKPFLIEIDEYENPCTGADMERYARENLRRWTPVVVAQYAHQQMRENAKDISDGICVCACKAAGLLYSNRLLPGALWVPDIAVPIAQKDGMITRGAGGRIVDVYGTRAFVGPGMPNVDPDGEPAPDGCAWLYISAPNVDYALTEIDVDANPLVRGNAKCPHAERKGIVRVDACDVFAVLMSLSCEGCDHTPEDGETEEVEK